MQLEVLGQAGPSILRDGSRQTLRQGGSGELIASALHGRYYEQTSRGAMFSANDTSSKATTVGTASPWAGFGILNPYGSGINLVVEKVSFAISTTFATSTPPVIGVMTVKVGQTSVGAGVIPSNRFITGTAGKATTVFSLGGLANTPTLISTFAFGGTALITTVGLGAAPVIDFEGAIVIPPNYYLLSYTSDVCGAWFGYQWEEVQI